MKSEEKSTNKERQALIIRKYRQYLKLEKALSSNTQDAYQTDLEKLLRFLEGENIGILDVTLDDLQRFAAGLHDIGIHPRSQARIPVSYTHLDVYKRQDQHCKNFKILSLQ